MSYLKFSLTIINTQQVKFQVEKLAKKPSIYVGMIRGAWEKAVKEAFHSGGFGLWHGIADDTVYRRKKGIGHYKRRRSSKSSHSGPPNLWSGNLRDGVAGINQSRQSFRASDSTDDIRIRTRISYADYAFSLRPLEGPVMNNIIDMVDAEIYRKLKQNLERL